jgi:membrane-bound serine protease (ClpP class)
MRRLLLILGIAWLLAQPALADSAVVRKVEFDTTVNPITKNRIIKAIDEAEENGEDLVLIILDTPGGLVISMEAIVKRMLASKVPTVVWVGPSGAHAASAGFFILIAADVATMAPATRTGAAAGVAAGQDNDEDDVMFRKVNEDLAAMVRSIAEKRGRNVEASAQAVFEAKAFEESVALEKGLIDFVVPSIEELLEQLNGREIELFDGTAVVLNTENPEFVSTEFDTKHIVMEWLAHPAVAYLLLTIGMLALYIEFNQPGLIFPGVIGALCLVLFAVSAQGLPVSALGIVLIILSIVLFVLEVKFASYGLLTAAGVASLIFGSMLLIDGPIPELRVPPSVYLPTSLLIAALCILALRFVIRAQQARVATGVEGLTGEVGSVARVLDPRGKVFVRGELWDATSEGRTIAEGERIRVVRVDELMLTVAPDDGRPPKGD